MKGSAALQSFQCRRSSLHQGKRIHARARRGHVHAPPAAGATPLVFFIPGLAMDALHNIYQFLKAALLAAATMGFLTVPLEY